MIEGVGQIEIDRHTKELLDGLLRHDEKDAPLPDASLCGEVQALYRFGVDQSLTQPIVDFF